MTDHLGAVLVSAHDTDQRCQCVKVHSPEPLELAKHRLLPGEFGGTYAPANVLHLCPTTHANLHELLRAIVRHGRPLTWTEARALNPGRPLSRYAFAMAHEGWKRMEAARG